VAFAQERWAAIDPSDERSSQMVWDSTRDGAINKAIAACTRTARSCALEPAVTDNMNDIFALMCCYSPEAACGFGVGSTKSEAREMIEETVEREGFSRCKLIRYIAARDGSTVN
jgi:hypothetical protein